MTDKKEDIISYEEIRKVQNAERDNNALQLIEPDFFGKVNEYIKNKKKAIEENEGKSNTFAQDMIDKNSHELRNAKKILKDLCVRRYRKLVSQAINNIFSRVHDTEVMLPEEEDFYNGLIKDLRNRVTGFMEKVEHKKEEDVKKNPEKLSLIRITDEVPAFVWKDQKTYGPYTKEDVVNLPKDIAILLSSQEKATEIVLDNQ